VRETEEENVAGLEIPDRGELEGRLFAEIGMHGVDVMAGVGLRRGLGDLDLRVAEEDPEHFSARVTRCADDTDRDHEICLQ
jgi:hypothetical protein